VAIFGVPVTAGAVVTPAAPAVFGVPLGAGVAGALVAMGGLLEIEPNPCAAAPCQGASAHNNRPQVADVT
jgi:hypothetical protein